MSDTVCQSQNQLDDLIQISPLERNKGRKLRQRKRGKERNVQRENYLIDSFKMSACSGKGQNVFQKIWWMNMSH